MNQFIHSPIEEHLGGFQVLSIINKASYKHPFSGFCVDISFQLLWVNIKEYNFWIIYLEHVYFYKNPLNCLPKFLSHFVLPPAMYDSSCCLISLPAFVVSVLGFGHSYRQIVASYCFNFHFLGGKQCGASFHMLICNLHIFFGEMVEFWALFYFLTL